MQNIRWKMKRRKRKRTNIANKIEVELAIIFFTYQNVY